RVAQALDDEADLAAEGVALQVAHPRQIELVDKLAVNQPLELLEALAGAALQPGLGDGAGAADAGIAQTSQTALQTQHGCFLWLLRIVLVSGYCLHHSRLTIHDSPLQRNEKNPRRSFFCSAGVLPHRVSASCSRLC